MTRCFPSSHTSPVFATVGFASSASTSKSSSVIFLSCTELKSCSISGGSKPVMPTSKSESSRSLIRSASSSLFHSPVILLRATLSAFSLVLSISTTIHSTSVYPRSARTVALWCPPIMVMSELMMIGSTYPNSLMEFLIFSYSLSPGFNFFLGL